MFMYMLTEKPEGKGMMLQSEEGASYLLETDIENDMYNGLKYHVLDSVGTLDGQLVVCNHIPVSPEGRSTFEDRFQKRARLIEKEPGFKAIRVLRPLTDDTYVIMTVWENDQAFLNWQQSKAYDQAHKKRETTAGVDQQKSIFPRPSFVKRYLMKGI
ncbi:antibiotic biosynthesis monooxygenase family protein [Bacillus kexueae]|uniref:antibiotic biosynthesis monooxygenase family protein n=1 Tax=Aeribacillus kexueae TaxID=2078952 RepID=UPI002435232C|nr:antibiotic biosynthesis monooxygenase [Bacillus kexueae]